MVEIKSYTKRNKSRSCSVLVFVLKLLGGEGEGRGFRGVSKTSQIRLYGDGRGRRLLSFSFIDVDAVYGDNGDFIPSVRHGGANITHVFDICLRFLSLGLPQIKILLSKTSYSRRSESFHSRRNCNCATRKVSKCDAEL